MPKVIERKLATENQEYRYHEKNGHKHQYRPENYREEIELRRSHMQDARRQAPKASCFWHAVQCSPMAKTKEVDLNEGGRTT